MPQDNPTNVTIADLQNVLVLIDLATQRGALRAVELASVGALYDKINKFINEAQAANNEKEV
jgi:hypothetical protein